MSDEEKESIEEFRKQLRLAINIDDVTTVIRNDNAQTILNLIEKQSKEIEELKKYKEGYKLLSYSLDNYTSKDKIKAKIEEIRKTHAPEDDYAESQIYILQSLLEKE